MGFNGGPGMGIEETWRQVSRGQCAEQELASKNTLGGIMYTPYSVRLQTPRGFVGVSI